MISQNKVSAGHEVKTRHGGRQDSAEENEKADGSPLPERPNSSLPSPAGLSSCTVTAGGKNSRRKDGAKSSKHRRRKVKTSPKPKGKGSGSPTDGQARHIADELNKFKKTKLYKTAFEKGFRSIASLNKFNDWAAAHVDEIDPDAIPFCTYCMVQNVELCDCFISTMGQVDVHEVDDSLVIPSGPKAPIELHYTWFGRFYRRVFRGYDRSRFNPNIVNNHHVNELAEVRDWAKHQERCDEDIIEPMYCYIRAHLNVSYALDGVDQRKARLAHAHKLALKWVEINKFTTRLTEITFVNMMQVTIQRCADQCENNLLYSYVDPNIRKPGLFKQIKRRILYKKD